MLLLLLRLLLLLLPLPPLTERDASVESGPGFEHGINLPVSSSDSGSLSILQRYNSVRIRSDDEDDSVRHETFYVDHPSVDERSHPERETCVGNVLHYPVR